MELNAEIQVKYVHRVRFARGIFEPHNTVLPDTIRHALPEDIPARVLVCLDAGVLAEWPDLPETIATHAANHTGTLCPTGPVHVVPGGEHAKNDPAVLRGVLDAIDARGLCRRSIVLAIGGGAVLDVVGYAAATAHRGVRLVRCPTTTLAQGDSGIGVKNGVNAFGKKNYLGAFDVPLAVINDLAFLETLDDRDWRNGFSEAVKVGLIKDRTLFDDLCAAATTIAARDMDQAAAVLQRSCTLHFNHICCGGDPFELGWARPLDFGHWAAHKLEQMSDFDLRHGEAVAIGIALDVAYGALTGMIGWEVVAAVHRCLSDLGFALFDERLRQPDTLLEGLHEFREHLGGRLAIPMLESVGQATVVHDIDPTQVRSAIDYLAGAVDNTRI